MSEISNAILFPSFFPSFFLHLIIAPQKILKKEEKEKSFGTLHCIVPFLI